MSGDLCRCGRPRTRSAWKSYRTCERCRARHTAKVRRYRERRRAAAEQERRRSQLASTVTRLRRYGGVRGRAVADRVDRLTPETVRGALDRCGSLRLAAAALLLGRRKRDSWPESALVLREWMKAHGMDAEAL